MADKDTKRKNKLKKEKTKNKEKNKNKRNNKTKDKDKDKDKDKKNEETENNEPVYTKPTTVFVNPPLYVLAKTGLEVCKTDEENFQPYTSPDNSEDNTLTEEEKHKEDSGVNAEDTGFTLLQGQVTDIKHLPYLYTADFEQDYLDMNNNGTVRTSSLPTDWSYKGVPVNLRRGWEELDKHLKWEDMDIVLEGFITDQTFSEEGTEIKISGKTKLLDRTYKFSFSQMSRSNIIKEVIKCAGLVPMVDATGLDDDMIDFTNVSTSGSKKSGSGDSANVHSTGVEDIDETVKKAIEGLTDDLEKAKAIDKAFKDHVLYLLYSNVKYSDIGDAWKNGNLNCADGANVLCAMFRAGGLNATILHIPPALTDGYGHYIVKVTINGKAYYTDNASNSGQHTSRPFGQVWKGATSADRDEGEKID